MARMFVKTGCIVLLCLSCLAFVAHAEEQIEKAEGADVDVQTEEEVSEDGPEEDVGEDVGDDGSEGPDEPEEPEELAPDSLNPARTDMYTETNQPGDCKVKAASGDMVTVEYTLYLPPRAPEADWKTDGQRIGGTEKDRLGNPRPSMFTLGQKALLMKGADEGIEGMCVGEDRSIIIPVATGYGDPDFEKANSQLVQQIQTHYGGLPVCVLHVKLYEVMVKGSTDYYWFWTSTYVSKYLGHCLIGFFVLVLGVAIAMLMKHEAKPKPKKEKVGKKGKKRQ